MGTDNIKFEFIKEAIVDTQAIIRAIDTKASIGLTILLVPLAQIGPIVGYMSSAFSDLGDMCSFIIPCSVVLLIALWISAALSLINVVFSIDNPASHINGGGSQSGCFYGGGMFERKLLDVFLNRSSLTSTKSLEDYYKAFQVTEEALIKELVFEKMKLCYVRDLKSKRLNFGLGCLFFWAVSSLLFYVLI